MKYFIILFILIIIFTLLIYKYFLKKENFTSNIKDDLDQNYNDMVKLQDKLKSTSLPDTDPYYTDMKKIIDANINTNFQIYNKYYIPPGCTGHQGCTGTLLYNSFPNLIQQAIDTPTGYWSKFPSVSSSKYLNNNYVQCEKGYYCDDNSKRFADVNYLAPILQSCTGPLRNTLLPLSMTGYTGPFCNNEIGIDNSFFNNNEKNTPLYYWSEPGSKTYNDTCPTGYFCRFGIAKKCPSGTFNDKINQIGCKICPSGMFSQEGSIKCEYCPDLTYNDIPGGICKTCPSGTYYDAPFICDQYDSTKTNCIKSHYDSSSINVCKNCENGKICKDGLIDICPIENSYIPPPIKIIVPQGDLGPQGKEIMVYDTNTLRTYATKEDCKTCNISDKSCYWGIKCVSGEEPDRKSIKSQATCIKCLAGTYSENGYECLKCPTGTWNNSSGSNICFTNLVCPTGFYCDNGIANKCPDGKISNVGSTKISQCFDCPEGYYCKNGIIQICPAGYYCPIGTNDPTPCKVGHNKFAPEGSPKCYNCYGKLDGGIGVVQGGLYPQYSKCLLKQLGEQCGASNQCFSNCCNTVSGKCVVNSYNLMCMDPLQEPNYPLSKSFCGKNQWSFGETCKDLSECPPGFYCTDTYRRCPFDTWSIGGSDTCKSTTDTPPGYEYNSSTRTIKKCEQGKWSDLGELNCRDLSQCPAGSRCVISNKPEESGINKSYLCDDNKSSYKGSTECYPLCPLGYMKDSTDPRICIEGYSSDTLRSKEYYVDYFNYVAKTMNYPNFENLFSNFPDGLYLYIFNASSNTYISYEPIEESLPSVQNTEIYKNFNSENALWYLNKVTNTLHKRDESIRLFYDTTEKIYIDLENVGTSKEKFNNYNLWGHSHYNSGLRPYGTYGRITFTKDKTTNLYNYLISTSQLNEDIKNLNTETKTFRIQSYKSGNKQLFIIATNK